MLTIRCLAIFFVSALLSGCATRPGDPVYSCPTPGDIGPSCWYKLHIAEKGINTTNGTVTATYTGDVIKDGGSAEKRFTFPVRDLERLHSTGRLKEGKDYLFVNGYGSPFLEALPEGYDLPSNCKDCPRSTPSN